MPQFAVREDGMLSEVEASDLANWYARQIPAVDSLTFETHIALMRAASVIRIDAPFEQRGGLTKARYNVLRLLYQQAENRMVMTGIVQGMNVSPTNVTKLVDGLEKDGYVRRAGNLSDKRKVWVELTEPGRDAVEETLPEVGKHVYGLWRSLSAEEKRVLVHLLSKLRLSVLSSPANAHVEILGNHPSTMAV